jgi:hypothetical protein
MPCISLSQVRLFLFCSKWGGKWVVMVVVIVVDVEVPVIGVGAVVVDTVDVFAVELQPTPSDNRRTSMPVSAQPTTRSRSPCVSDMSYTAVPAKGRRTSGGRPTKGDRVAPCALRICAEMHMPRKYCATDSIGSGFVGCAVKCSGAG